MCASRWVSGCAAGSAAVADRAVANPRYAPPPPPVRAFSFAIGCLRAARVLHDELLRRLLHAPMAFFDTTPLGRVLNRCSADQFSVDEQLPFQLNIFLAQSVGLAGSMVVLAVASPPLLAALPVLAALYFLLQRRYRPASRDLKRLDSVLRSPLYALFAEALAGAVHVRALRAQERLFAENCALLEGSQRAYYAGCVAAQWLAFRLQGLGVLVLCCVVGLAVRARVLRAASRVPLR